MTIYTQIDANKRRTTIVMFVFIAVIGFLGWLFGEYTGYGLSVTAIALIIAGCMSFASYWWSDSIVLSLSQARKIQLDDIPELYRIVENLCIAAGIPQPRIYLIEDTAPNAFATGRDPEHAVICVTTGLLQKLDKLELEGVIAHELSHIRNYDTRLMSIVVILVGVIALLSDWFTRGFWFGGNRRDRGSSRIEGQLGLVVVIIGLILAIVSPIIAQLLKLALSRKREYLADASGVLLTRYPEGLARALEKISRDNEPLEAANKATAHLYIVNPLKDHRNFLNNLFSTHPPIENRIAALRSM